MQSGELIAENIKPHNARHIVRACNCHDELLAAATHLLACLNTPLGTGITAAMGQLAAAIAKAEGRS